MIYQCIFIYILFFCLFVFFCLAILYIYKRSFRFWSIPTHIFILNLPFLKFISVARNTPTWLEGLQRQSPLSSSLGTVIFHNSKAQEAHLFKVHSELKVLVPHGIEGVAVDGFGAEVAAVNRHTQNIHLEAGATSTVPGADVLPRNNL